MPTTGPSSSQTPYLVPVAQGVDVKSILTTGDAINGYKMAGLPDGLGAFDNDNGTFTLLMNHEIAANVGAVRAHGSTGAFVSKWVINKSDLSVVSGGDLIQSVYVWDSNTNTFTTGTTAFSRFCSADLAPVTAYYNSVTGLGTQNRIFLNGEETGPEGRAFAHIVTGSSAGTTYQLPRLGKLSFENAIASPTVSNKTVVAALDDNSTNGQVYIYVGTKTNTGTDIDKAGLNNGKLFGVSVAGLTAENRNATVASGTRFTLADLGSVQNTTGAALDAASTAAGVTSFLRPEDGVWDPSNPRDFYFNTTDRLDQVSDGVGSQVGNSRVWRLRFDDPTNPELGGTIEAVVDGLTDKDVNGNSVKVNMLDNIAIDKYGHLFMLEDVGNADHNSKVWQYDIETDSLTQLTKFDTARFGDVVNGSITAPTAPFTRDEETSGIIDAEDILGAGWFLIDAQAHYPNTDTSLVEGGQLLAFYNPDTAASAPKMGKTGSDTFTLSGKKPKLEVSLVGRNSNLVNELGVFTVDDAQGKINGIAPGQAGYTEAALERARVIFSAISNNPNGFNPNESTRLLEFESGNNVRFLLVKNSTIDAASSGQTSLDNVLISSDTTQKVTDLGNNSFTLSWEDKTGNSTDFKDLEVKIKSSNKTLELGTKLQGEDNAELIDLRGLSGQVNASFSVYREASFSNEVYFYKVDNVDGLIGSINPDTANPKAYMQAALGNLVKDSLTGQNMKLNAPNQGVQTGTAKVEAGSIYAPMIIINGTLDQLTDNNISNDPQVYFPYLGANTDGFDHIRLLGNNTFGFEDLPKGGDVDYNDMIVKINFSA
jgi:hypothetical protein